MWADTETAEDFLNYTETAGMVAELLRRDSLLPISIGLFGGWGVGKSSLSRMVFTEIENDERYLTVEFDAWQFQDYDDARAALLQIVAEKLYTEVERQGGAKEKIKSLIRRVDKLRLLGLVTEVGLALSGFPTFGAAAAGISGLGSEPSEGGPGDETHEPQNPGAAIDSVVSKLKPGEALLNRVEQTSPPEEVTKFKAEFNEILSELGKVLVVFIDNLDRCLPKNCIETLEAVRLFLFIPNTAFVITADEEMVKFAVSSHYDSKEQRHIDDYIDKFVQIPINVPRPDQNQIRSYVCMLLLNEALTDNYISDSTQGKIREILLENLRDSWKEPPISIDALLEHLTEDETLSEPQRNQISHAFDLANRMAPLMVSSKKILGNPRIAKRILNTTRMRSLLAKQKGLNIDETVLAKLAILERCASTDTILELYRAAVDQSGEASTLLKTLEQAATALDLPDNFRDDADFLLEWAKIDPPLADQDLRAAIYLSRDSYSISDPPISESIKNATLALMAAKSQTSPSANKIAQELSDEDAITIAEIIRSRITSKSPDWNAAPDGFWGLAILSNHSSGAADILKQTIRTVIPMPRWMQLASNNKPWNAS